MSGLNPCSNGRYSLRIETLEKGDVFMGLNPCSNGRYSLRDEDVPGLIDKIKS